MLLCTDYLLFFPCARLSGKRLLDCCSTLGGCFAFTALFTGVFFLAVAFLGTDYLAAVLFYGDLFPTALRQLIFSACLLISRSPADLVARMVGDQALMC